MAILVRTNPEAFNFLDAAGIARTEANGSIVIGICQLTTDLKQYGLWDKMKAIYPFVGGTSGSHKFNLKDPRDTESAFRLVFSGSWSHSSDGVVTNGSNAYADTYLNASSNLSTTNAHFSIYVKTFAGSGDRINGAYPGLFIDQFNNTSIYYGIGFDTEVSNVVTTQLGFTQINALSDRALFKDGGKIHSGLTGGSLPSRNLWLGASNNNGTGQYWWNGTLSLASIGDGLTDTEAANLYTAVQRFQTTLGRQV